MGHAKTWWNESIVQRVQDTQEQTKRVRVEDNHRARLICGAVFGNCALLRRRNR